MRIVVIDSDAKFTSDFESRCKSAGVACRVFTQPTMGFGAVKRDPESIDIVLIGKELENGPSVGLEVAQELRSNPRTIDVPYIILSSSWGKAEFAKHQKTGAGANAYYNKKSAMTELESMIEAVTGLPFSKPKNEGSGFLNIKLELADNVIQADEATLDRISITEPINLFLPQDQVDVQPPMPDPALEAVPAPISAAAAPLPPAVEEPLSIAPVEASVPAPAIEAFSSLETQSPSSEEPRAVAPDPLPPEPNPPVARDVPESEDEAAKDLPYLFSSNGAPLTSVSLVHAPSPSFSSDNDIDTLKKYLTMREQDVSVLNAQLSYAKEELAKSENTIKRLAFEGEGLFHQIADLKKRIETQEHELAHAGSNKEAELDQFRFEVKSKADRVKFLEGRLADSEQQYEKLKERVRLDIRKIRVREKELESKLEILKKDSETLIAARENKILELKRKIDLLEFNYDTLQGQNELERQKVRKAHEKIERVHKVLKLATSIVEAQGDDFNEEGSSDGDGKDQAAASSPAEVA